MTNTAGANTSTSCGQQGGGGIVCLKVGGTVTVSENATLRNSYTSQGGGAISNNNNDANANSSVTMDGGIIENCGTDANGGAISLGKGTMTLSGGVIRNNHAFGNGAAIYITQGATLELSGNPIFGSAENSNANTVTIDGYSDKTNGGESKYTDNKARQDIFIAGSGNPLGSIKVTDAISSGAGSIWVWADNVNHYDMLKQFAVIDDSLISGTGENAKVVFDSENTDAQNAALLDSTMKAFRNAQPDNMTNCGGDYLTGQKGDVINYIYWTGGFDVVFLKTDGFDHGLAGATFTLYTNEACTSEFQMTFMGSTPASEDGKRATTTSSDGTKTYRDKVGTTVTLAEGEVLLSKVAPKTYYMKETTAPTGFELDTTIYKVDVSSTGELAIHKNSSASDTTYSEEVYKVQTQSASGTDPAVYQYHLMNNNSIERKVILRKVSDTHSSLENARFRIFRADLTEYTEDQPSGKSYYESGTSGVYFIGNLPVGKYYLVETQVPNATTVTNSDGSTTTTAYSDNNGKVFVLNVTADGITQNSLGKVDSSGKYDDTILKTNDTTPKKFDTGTEEARITAFKTWIKSQTTDTDNTETTGN